MLSQHIKFIELFMNTQHYNKMEKKNNQNKWNQYQMIARHKHFEWTNSNTTSHHSFVDFLNTEWLLCFSGLIGLIHVYCTCIHIMHIHTRMTFQKIITCFTLKTFNSNSKSLKCIWFANGVNIKVFRSFSTDKRAHIRIHNKCLKLEFQAQYNGDDDSTQLIHKYKHFKLFYSQ